MAQVGPRGEVRSLFNGRDLSGWDRYLGVEEVPTLPFNLFGRWPAPIGREHDSSGVYSVVREDGVPVIRISGSIWGALISRAVYENYHLRVDYKWGRQKFAPRADAPRNTGVLYHSVGPDGAFWSYWMRSAEFEIMEGRTGDFTSVDGIEGVTTSDWDLAAGYPWLRYSRSGSETGVGGMAFRVAARDDFEKPVGQWNRIDLFVFGDSAVHVVNGTVVFAIDGLRHEVDGEMVPLTKGAIQLQSEGAEVFFRRIELQPIESLEAAWEMSPEVGR